MNLTLNFYAIIGEVFIILNGLLLLIFGVIFSYQPKLGYIVLGEPIKKLVFQVLILTFILLWNQIPIYSYIWNNFFLNTSFAYYSKILVLFVLNLWVLFTFNYTIKEKIITYEYWILVLLNIVAIFLIIQVNDLLSMYLTIEFQSLIFYILASFKRNSEFSTESGLKYFILGAFSSALLLIGCSLLYSITGLTNFNDLALFNIQIKLISDSYIYNLIFFSLNFIFISFLFKLSVAPFHMWAPDVYEGAPSSITALFAVMPKLPILGLILKYSLIIFYDFFNIWLYFIIFCIICSSFIGTFSAFLQVKWKRFIVFSSISHLSFFLIAIISNNLVSISNLFIYLIIYLIMSIGFFALFTNLYIYKFPFYAQIRFFKDLNFFALLNPLLGIFFGIVLFSMAGVPPLAGFFAKFFVIASAIKNHLFVLVTFILLCNCVSCFYYIRLIKLIYFDIKTEHNFLVIFPIEKTSSYILGLCMILLIYFFLDIELVFLISNLLSFGFF